MSALWDAAAVSSGLNWERKGPCHVTVSVPCALPSPRFNATGPRRAETVGAALAYAERYPVTLKLCLDHEAPADDYG